MATDGNLFEAEDVTSDDPPIARAYDDFPNHFGFLLSFAGITTVKPPRESSFEIQATSRLNWLYVEPLKDNADSGPADRRREIVGELKVFPIFILVRESLFKAN